MICAVVVCFLAYAVFLLFQLLFRFHAHTVSDVVALVRFVDESELQDLGSEVIEENLRASLSPVRFKVEQLRRALLLFEYLRRMSFNAWVLLSWAYHEEEKFQNSEMPTDDTRSAMRDVIATGTDFRLYSLLMLVKLSSRLVLSRLRIAPLPRLAILLRPGETHALTMYRDLVSAAIKLSASAGTDAQNRLATSLFGRFG
jgi:hypothetical protein